MAINVQELRNIVHSEGSHRVCEGSPEPELPYPLLFHFPLQPIKAVRTIKKLFPLLWKKYSIKWLSALCTFSTIIKNAEIQEEFLLYCCKNQISGVSTGIITVILKLLRIQYGKRHMRDYVIY